MYFLDSNNNNNVRRQRVYITKPFKTNPILYVAGSELLVKKLLIHSSDLASRFRLIEPPKSKLDDLLKQHSKNNNNSVIAMLPEEEEVIDDIDPLGGTLVLFDSVSLPHEVLPTRNKERWACSGWYHEDQQEISTM